MKALTTLLVFCAIALSGLAADDTTSLKALLTKQAYAWDAAIVRKDKAGIVQNMGADFRHIGPTAEVRDGPKFLADLLDPELTIDPYTVEDLDIRLYGEIALLSGTSRMTGTDQGKPFKSHYRFVDTYHLQAGRWVVVNIQITRFRE